MIIGTLTRAGTFPIREEETTGFVVSCTPEDLARMQFLPMYRRVAIVPADQAVDVESLQQIIAAAGRATEAECSCGGHPADDPQCCPACKVYHRIEAAKRAMENAADQPRVCEK